MYKNLCSRARSAIMAYADKNYHTPTDWMEALSVMNKCSEAMDAMQKEISRLTHNPTGSARKD